MKRAVFTTVSIVVLMTVACTDVFACSCSLPLPKQSLKKQVKKSLAESRAVFSGKVLEVTADPQKYSVVVRVGVERSWKGSPPEEVSIVTGRGGGDCGYRFEVGESYLIYAYGSKVGGLGTNICQRTAKLSEAAKDLQILGRGGAGKRILPPVSMNRTKSNKRMHATRDTQLVIISGRFGRARDAWR